MAINDRPSSSRQADDKRQLLRDLLRSRDGFSHQPVSAGQRALWVAHQLDPASPAYNVISRWRVRGPLDVAALDGAFQALVDRHGSLRTTFAAVKGEPVRRVHDRMTVAFQSADAVGWDADRLERALIAESERPFDLDRGPVFRVHLFSTAPDDHVLLLSAHHIAYDHWSLARLMDELRVAYRTARGDREAVLPPLRAQFTDYVNWQADLLRSDEGRRLFSYWDAQLAGERSVLDLPADRPRPAAQTFRGESYFLTFRDGLLEKLSRVARSEGATPYMVLLAAFVALLHRYTGQEDLLVGSPTSGRSRPEFGDVIGYFVNPVVIRQSVSKEMPFRTLLAAVRNAVLGAIEHADLPFATIVDRLKLAHDQSRSPLFQAAFTWDKLDLGDGARQSAVPSRPGDDLAPEFMMGTQMGSNFDLDLIILEREASLEATWRFSTDLFDRDTIARMARHYAALVDHAIDDASARISDLSLVADSERTELLFKWNPGVPAACSDKTLVGWFEDQAARTPAAVAATFEGAALTYAELNARANRLAHHLRACGTASETTIGLCVGRSLSLVIGIVGILKAGAAYVPVDPSYPAERIRFILNDARVRLVVTETALLPAIDSQYETIALDSEAARLDARPATNPDVAIDPASLAYVIYTSGSTGQPKGVGVTHACVTRLFDSTEDWFGFGSSDVWTLFHSAAFDFSVWELWGALLFGGTVVVVPFWVSRSPDAFRALLAENGVTVLNQTPSAFRQLIEADEHSTAGPLALRFVIFGGEALDVRMLRAWVARHGVESPRLVNMYGITETTVHVTFRPLAAEDILGGTRSVIGAPISDLSLYLLDEHFEPVPIGMRGELVVGGAGVTRGYLHRPSLTAERFVPDPFSSEPGARLYRSGDVARRLPDGDFEYLGRADQQVKIRGFRIELAEIEQQLGRHAAVREALVLAQPDSDGNARLTAYIVPDKEAAGPLRTLLSWERTGRLKDRSWYELPNGLSVVQLNRNETDFLYREIFDDQQYLRHGIRLDPEACVFDVGANIGMFSLFVGLRSPGARIFAFEPIAPVCELLRLNAELYALDLHAMERGLSDGEGEAAFTYYPNVSIFSGRFGDAGHERGVVEAFLRNQRASEGSAPELLDELLDDRLVSETVHCKLTTVSAVMREHEVERIDLLKIDVEKSELAVLRGIDESDWPKIRQVIVEVHDEAGRLNDVTSLLEHRGFSVATEQDASLTGTDLHSVYAVREVAASSAGTALNLKWSAPGALTKSLREQLAQALPDYMVPSGFVLLDALPLTANGKLDRRTLPGVAASQRSTVAPRTELEEQIAAIWREVLQVERLGVTDDFFELGGHSLFATKVIARLRAAISVDLPLRSLFEAPTIEGLALAVVERQALEADPEVFRRALAGIEGL